MSLFDAPHGGSLNSCEFDGEEVIKRYAGPIERGHEKLDREHRYLRKLPPQALAFFNAPVRFQQRYIPHRETTLVLQRHPEPSVAKALLSGVLTPERMALIVRTLGRTLTEELYPLTHVRMSGGDLYERYHGSRLHVVDQLAALPALAPLFASDVVIVNGVRCPSIRETLEWLHGSAGAFFETERICVRAHLDTHLDNVLAPLVGPPRIVLVDPRGEPFGPPHYDWAKILKSLRSFYHLVHYDHYDLALTVAGAVCSVRLETPPDWTACLAAGLDALLASAPAYAAAEGVTLEEFIRSALAAELVHFISFAFYHAHRPEGMDAKRVRAYLAIATLLARRLMSGAHDLDSLRQPLLKGT